MSNTPWSGSASPLHSDLFDQIDGRCCETYADSTAYAQNFDTVVEYGLVQGGYCHRLSSAPRSGEHDDDAGVTLFSQLTRDSALSDERHAALQPDASPTCMVKQTVRCSEAASSASRKAYANRRAQKRFRERQKVLYMPLCVFQLLSLHAQHCFLHCCTANCNTIVCR